MEKSTNRWSCYWVCGRLFSHNRVRLLRRNFRKGSERARIDRRTLMRKPALRWGRGLALIALGVFSLPFTAFNGRAAIVASVNRIARGAGRIAAEFNLFYDEYR